MISKKVFIAFLILIVSSVFTGCKNKSEPPEIKVTSGIITIASIVDDVKWEDNEAEGAIGSNFKSLVNGVDLPYLKLDDDIKITISGDNPDSAILEDFWLAENGNMRVKDTRIMLIPIEFQDSKSSFKLPRNRMTMVSSNIHDYAPGNSFRGFRLTCTWGEKSCEYAFALRTDADYTNLFDLSLSD